MHKNENETGYTMIETIAYISVLGVIGIVLASYVGKVFMRYKIGRATQQIVELRKSILNYSAADEDYQNVTLNNMQNAKALPLDLIQGYHALNGKIDLNVLPPNSTNSAGSERFLFYITFENLDYPACVELLAQGQFYGDGADLDTLIVNNNTAWRYERSYYKVDGISTQIQSTTIRPQLSEIYGACSSQNPNIIKWIFS